MHVGVCLQQNHGMAKDSKHTNSNCTGSGEKDSSSAANKNRATRPVQKEIRRTKESFGKARKRELLLQDKIEDLKSDVEEELT